MMPNSYFPHVNNIMHAENVAISDIAANVATPFYCYSSSAIEDSYIAYQSAFAQAISAPDSKKSSEQESLSWDSVKANGNQAVLTTLAK